MTSRADETTVGHLLRELAPQVLGAVARRHGDFDTAEDAVQEALLAAATQWPGDGVPANPRGWLYHVALRRMTDLLRSEMARRRREDAVASDMRPESTGSMDGSGWRIRSSSIPTFAPVAYSISVRTPIEKTIPSAPLTASRFGLPSISALRCQNANPQRKKEAAVLTFIVGQPGARLLNICRSNSHPASTMPAPVIRTMPHRRE